MKLKGNELRDAIEYTAEQSGFSARLIEKDYYCSLVLKELYGKKELAGCMLFKGGTLLAKSYSSFYRLSEDLDFSVSNSMCATRNLRKQFSEILRTQIKVTIERLDLREVAPFKGANESRQYNAVFQYDSVIGPPETIKFDLGLRNDVLDDVANVSVRTLLLSPFRSADVLPGFTVSALSVEETFAEKVRAALTRVEPAIRDFFDIWAASKTGVLPTTEKFLSMTSKKLDFDKHAKLDLSFSKRKTLESQITHELNVVLKSETAKQFVLAEAWELVESIQKRLPKLAK